MKIKLGGKLGGYATIDDCDADKVAGIKWYSTKRGYVLGSKGKGNSYLLHRRIMGAKKGEQVDHIDHDCQNNTRSNLRICNASQNGANRTPFGASRFLGVQIGNKNSPKAKRWEAVIYKYKKRVRRKLFHTQEEAARQYDEWAKEIHGEFANLNFK